MFQNSFQRFTAVKRAQVVSSWPNSLCFDILRLIELCSWIYKLRKPEQDSSRSCPAFFLDPFANQEQFSWPGMLAAFFLTVLKDRTGRVCQTVSNVQDECVKLYQTYRTSVSNCIKLSASSGLAPSPVLDLDQFCQAGEQAGLNSIGGLTSF